MAHVTRPHIFAHAYVLLRYGSLVSPYLAPIFVVTNFDWNWNYNPLLLHSKKKIPNSLSTRNLIIRFEFVWSPLGNSEFYKFVYALFSAIKPLLKITSNIITKGLTGYLCQFKQMQGKPPNYKHNLWITIKLNIYFILMYWAWFSL